MSSILTYPTGGEYREALQNPKLCFRDPALAAGEVVMDQLGMPKPISGASASVFTIRTADSRRWAVKCFTRLIDHQGTRYQRISQTLQTVSKPWRVAFDYLPDGVLCNGRWYPVLKMEWVEAVGLISFIEQHLLDRNALGDLAVTFANMVHDLSVLGIAHGDLQHGNLLVTASGALKLVDYDGMFVPSLVQMGACEKGHINYQSPTRTMSTWGPYLDNFSAWIIYASLVALTIEPTLWTLLHSRGDEALLFRYDDFVDYRSSRAFLALNQSSQPELKALGIGLSGLWNSDVRSIPALSPASLPEPNRQSTVIVAAVPATSAGLRPVPDWVTQPQPRTPPTSAAAQGDPSWITGHLPALPQVAFNPSRLAPRIVAILALAAIVAVGISATTNLLPVVVASAAASFAILMFVVISTLLFRRTSEWKAKHEKLIFHGRRRAEADKAAREVSSLEQVKGGIDSREKKAVDKITKDADKAKATEQKELASINSRLATQIQGFERQRNKLQSSELREAGQALRAHQQQHVMSYLSRAHISSAGIPGIGAGVTRSLAACGIVSAADFSGITYQTGPRGGQQVYIRLRTGRSVHPSGVGEKKARDLESWRSTLEMRAKATQPASLPAAQAQAINARFLQQRQALVDQEKVAQVTAVSDQRQIGQKWAPTHTAFSAELIARRQAFGQERAQADASLATAKKQASVATWQRDLARREIAAYRNISYWRYLAGIIRT
jgi:hypothetical protein